MIKILVKKYNDKIVLVEVKGHANYAKSGSDIVCAAVSSIVQTSVNAVLSFDESSITYVEGEGLARITVLKQNEIILKLLDNMIYMLKQLESDYPKNVNIRNEG